MYIFWGQSHLCLLLKFGFSEKATKFEKNLHRTFDKSVVFCACNSLLVKKLTKNFQNKCGQVLIHKLYKRNIYLDFSLFILSLSVIKMHFRAKNQHASWSFLQIRNLSFCDIYRLKIQYCSQDKSWNCISTFLNFLQFFP